MKRLAMMMVAALAAAAIAGAQDGKPIKGMAAAIAGAKGNVTPERALEMARAYVTNGAWSAKTAWIPVGGTDTVHLAALDDILKAKPPLSALRSPIYSTKMPQTFAAALSAWGEEKPYMTARAREAQRNGDWRNAHKRCGFTKEQEAAFHAEMLNFRDGETLGKWRGRMGKALAGLIVPTLRRQGKAVTTGPDGQSPVKAYADRISAALDAPRFEGLQAILDEMGVPAKLDLSDVPTAEEARELARRSLAGETSPFSQARLNAKISAALGTEAYNAYVEAYNGGTR